MRRVKFWDSCQFQTYSKHANNHNPRSHIYQRLRNRILHKFLYFQQNFNHFLCVGCGRCNLYCPMQLDLPTIVSKVNLQGETPR
jgi:formate hydrogenlyase subunit 6/NADH:ubiquinone oxidoreductase subunit I